MNFGVTSACRAKGRIVEDGQVFLDRNARRRSGGRPAAPSTRLRSLASAWIKLASTAKPSTGAMAALQDGLESAVAANRSRESGPWRFLREGRVVRHRAVEPEPAETTDRQGSGEPLQIAAAPSGCRSKVAHDQHPDHQLRIDRRAPYLAVETASAPASARRVRQNRSIDRSRCLSGTCRSSENS